MFDKSIVGSPKRLTVIVLAAVAALAASALLYTRAVAAGAASDVAATEKRLDDDRDLARQYKMLSGDALAMSASQEEALSSSFLQSSLKKNGITASVEYGNPTDVQQGAARRVKISITSNGPVALARAAAFLYDVDTNRRNIALINGKVTRSGDADSWDMELTYVALIGRT